MMPDFELHFLFIRRSTDYAFCAVLDADSFICRGERGTVGFVAWRVGSGWDVCRGAIDSGGCGLVEDFSVVRCFQQGDTTYAFESPRAVACVSPRAADSGNPFTF